jgi:colanic acid/amylovoran biosynthesis glycosyltransferase
MRLAMFRHTLGIPSEQFIEDQRLAFDEVQIVGMRHDSRTAKVPGQCVVTSQLPMIRDIEDIVFRAVRRSRPLEAEFARIKPDAVIAQFLFDAWRVLPTCERLNIPLVALAHGSELTLRPDLARNSFRSLRQLTERWSDFTSQVAVFGAVSQYLAGMLLERGVDAHKVIQTYVGTPILAPRFRRKISPDAPILFVGRLEPNKGADLAIEAHLACRSAGVNRALMIIGDGSELPNLRKKVLDLRLDGSVHFLGVRPHSEVVERMRSAFVLVSPSRTLSSGISEGLGQVSIEAQAVGTPVVVAATGGLPETVDDRISGFVVPPDSPGAIALPIIELDEDPHLWEEMSVAAIRQVGERFEPRINAKRFADSIRLLLEEGTG